MDVKSAVMAGAADADVAAAEAGVAAEAEVDVVADVAENRAI